MKKTGFFLAALLFPCTWLMATGASDGSGASASAASWPRQSINLVVAFGAGGNSDYNARAMAKYLSRELGQPIVITNVGASGGTVAAAQVKDAKPDGYTVLVHQLSLNIAQASGMVNFGYADFAPVCVFAKAAEEVIAVRSGAPWNTVQELIADSQKTPGKIKLTANTGASTQWVAIAFQNAGARFNVVSSGGSGERIPLLLGGHVDLIPIQVNMIQDYLKTNQFKILATVSPRRSAAWPNVPTLAESGVNCGYNYLNTFFMPRGTDPAIVAKFSAAVARVAAENSGYRQEIAAFGQEPFYMDAAATTEHFSNELKQLMNISEQLRGKK
jgi:tripartite-type tricarboxylate transporter receptor subunit TctC